MNRDINSEDSQPSPISKKPTLALLVTGAIMLLAPLGAVFGGMSTSLVSWLLYVMLAGGIVIGYWMKKYFDSLRIDESENE